MTIAIRQRGKVIPVERRRLSMPAATKPKVTSVQTLQAIAANLRDMPRECATDRIELLLWLSRTARQIDAIALDGFEASSPRAVEMVSPDLGTPMPARASNDPQEAAEAVFAGDRKPKRARRSTAATTVRSRKGDVVKVETRRRTTDAQTSLFPIL